MENDFHTNFIPGEHNLIIGISIIWEIYYMEIFLGILRAIDKIFLL